MCAVSAPLSAADGVVIVVRVVARGNSSMTDEIRVEKSRMRDDVNIAATHLTSQIFDAQQRRLWLVTHVDKTYSELSESDADQYRKEWRELGRPPMPGVTTEYRQTGTDTVGRWTCTRYERYENTRRLEELCVLDPQELGLAAADFDVVRRHGEFIPSYPPNFSGLVRISRPDGSVFDALPVRRVTGTGDLQLAVEIVDVRRQTFADAIFDVPDGFKRVPMIMPKAQRIGSGLGTGTGSGLGPGPGAGVGVSQPGNGVTTPRLLHEVKPSYTSEALRAKIEGKVLLSCVVRPDGSVSDVTVVRSLDRTFGLDEQAIVAAKQWRFAPGTRLGEAVAVLVTIEMSFTIKKDPTETTSTPADPPR
jgi:TonB family protein